MTIVLGSEDRPQRIPTPRSATPGVRDGATWERRRFRHRAESAANEFPTWQPRPDDSRSRSSIPASGPEPALRPGMVGLYSDRMGRPVVVADRTRRIADRERTLAGDQARSVPGRRSLAIIEGPRRLGRGSEAHYRALHPSVTPSYGRLRSRSALSVPRFAISPQALRQRGGRAMRAGGATALDLVQSVFVPSVYGTARPHVNTARRILVGTVAAFMVLVGATGTGFAGQQRYEAPVGIVGVPPEASADPGTVTVRALPTDVDRINDAPWRRILKTP